MRKLGYMLIVLVIVVIAVSFAACDEEAWVPMLSISKVIEEMDEFEYFANDENVTIIAPKDKNLSVVTIPACVTEIKATAFDGCSSLEKVIFEDGSQLREVNTFAFRNCISLKNVSFPSSLKAIGDKVFFGCTALEYVEYDASALQTFGNRVFQNCTALKSIIVPSQMTVSEKEFSTLDSLERVELSVGVKDVGNNAFKGKAITSLSLPDTLVSIGDYAFFGNRLKLIDVPDSVQSIGQNAFYSENTEYQTLRLPFVGCNKNVGTLTSVFSEQSLATVKELVVSSGRISEHALVGLGESSIVLGNEVEISKGALDDTWWYKQQPDGIVYIGNVLYGCKNDLPIHTKIKVAEGTVEIVDEAFLGQTNAVSLDIPSSVVRIGDRVIAQTSVSVITVSSDNKMYKSEENCLLSQDGKTLVMGCLGSTIPSSIEIIGKQAFSSLYIDGICIPKNVRTIEYAAFYQALNLSHLEFEEGSKLETIAEFAFAFSNSNSKLLDLSALTELKTIGDHAFFNSEIEQVLLPQNVSSIGENVWGKQLKGISIDNKNTTYRMESGCLMKGETVVLGFDCGVIPSSATEIADYAYYYAKSLSSADIIISDKITKIGSHAFENVEFSTLTVKTKIESGHEKCGLQYVDPQAFGSKRKLDKLTATAGAISILEGCISSVNTVEIIGSDDIPDGLLTSKGVSTVLLAEGVKKIGSFAFAYCKITTFTVPASVNELGAGVLFACPIESFEVLEGNARYYVKNNYIIDRNSHSIVISCKNSGKIPTTFKVKTIDNKNVKVYDVSAIEPYAFAGSLVDNIVIPGNIKTIGDYAFLYCSTSEITMQEGVEKIGVMAFYLASNLNIVSVPDSVQSIGYSAFEKTPFYQQKQSVETGIVFVGKVVYAYNGSKENVSELKIEEGAVGIAQNAFLYMTELEKIILPSTLKHIDKEAFYGCTQLCDIYFNGTDSQWNGITKEKKWDLSSPWNKTVWTKCVCVDKYHDHDDDGVINGVGDIVDECPNYKKNYMDICDECVLKNVIAKRFQ